MSEDRELDVVVFGATGFAGGLVAGYLASHAPGGVRVGLAGRSARRLADVQAGLGPAASAWPLLAADSADPASVAALARAARVVVSTVGPYRGQGLALVEACAAAGTDYADLAGEVLFIRDSIDRCHEAAAKAGTRIVHCCGFDSVPSDLGALLLHDAARADDAGDLRDTTLVVTALKGGVSGGLKAVEAGLAFGPSRALLGRLLPAPGQGPGEKTRRTGYFRIQIHTSTSAGARYLGIIEARGDPGYAATSVMLGESALCLALDRDHLPDRAGVLTPATAMGTALAARLRSAGHTLATQQINR